MRAPRPDGGSRGWPGQPSRPRALGPQAHGFGRCMHAFVNLRPVDRLPAAQIPIEKFWGRARPAQIEWVATLVFSPEDLLLHVALILRLPTDSWAMPGRYANRPNVRAIRGCDRLESSYCGGTCLPDGEAARLCPALGTRVGRGGRTVPGPGGAEGRALGKLPLGRPAHGDGRSAGDSPRSIAAPIPSVARLAAHLLKHHRAKDGVTMAFRELAGVCRRRLQRAPLVRASPGVRHWRRSSCTAVCHRHCAADIPTSLG